MAAEARAQYRRLLREIAMSYRSAAQERAPSIRQVLRQGLATAEPAVAARQATAMASYLKSHRLHQALVARYNPGTDLTSADRVKASARRVGFDLPGELDLDTPVEPLRRPPRRPPRQD